jgi:hypothetical protein
MKNIDEKLQNASNLKLDKELLSDEEIRSIVNNLPDKSSKFVKLIKRIIIMTVPVFIVFISLYFAVLDEPASEQEKVSPQKLNNSIIINNFGEDEKNSESIDVKSIDVRSIEINSKVDSLSTVTEKSKSKLQSYTFELKVDTSTSKKSEKYLESLPWNIEGLTVLKLSDEEFEKLVPNSRHDDTTFFIYEEKLLTEDRNLKLYQNTEYYKHSDLQTLKYTEHDLPLIGFKKLKEQRYRKNYDTEISIYELEKYKKTLYVAHSTSTELGSIFASYTSTAPILLDKTNDPFILNYVEFGRSFSKKISDARKEKDSVKSYNLHKKSKELSNKLFQILVPVQMEILPGTHYIFWFYPNEEFLSALPERYSVNLRKELEVKRLLESGALDISDACKGLDADNSVFGLCRYSEGAIKFDNLYPNPESIQSKLSFTLMKSRKLNIIIHDVNGRIVKELVNDVQYNAGSHDIDIPLDDLPSGINYIIIKTNENETIVKRMIKM